MSSSAPLSIHIRARTPADDSFIERLAAQAFAEYSGQPAPSVVHLARAGSAWIAERAGAPVGFAVVRGAGAERAELCAIAVEEYPPALGVGRALLTQVERALTRAGTHELTLHTADANASALELFSKRGFRAVQRLPRYYRGVYDAWTMRKSLG